MAWRSESFSFPRPCRIRRMSDAAPNWKIDATEGLLQAVRGRRIDPPSGRKTQVSSKRDVSGMISQVGSRANAEVSCQIIAGRRPHAHVRLGRANLPNTPRRDSRWRTFGD